MMARRSLTSIGLSIAMIIVFASAANSKTITNRGSTGKVTTPRVQGYNSYTGTAVRFPARHAYRTSAYPRRRQAICLTVKLWQTTMGYSHLNPWEYIGQVNRGCHLVDPGYFTTFGTFDVEAIYNAAYSGMAVFKWKVGGTVVGRKFVDFNRGSDYQCLTSLDFCATGNNPTVGGYIFFAILA
jgi:hypothetical protein